MSLSKYLRHDRSHIMGNELHRVCAVSIQSCFPCLILCHTICLKAQGATEHPQDVALSLFDLEETVGVFRGNWCKKKVHLWTKKTWNRGFIF